MFINLVLVSWFWRSSILLWSCRAASSGICMSSLALQPNQAADQNSGRCPDYCREHSICWRLRVNGNFFPGWRPFRSV